MNIRDYLKNELNVEPYVMTTGSDGLHVALSIKREEKFDKVKEKASKIASSLVKRLPEIYTTEIRKNKKLILGGLLFSNI